MSFGTILPAALGAAGALAGGLSESKAPSNPYSGREVEAANKLGDVGAADAALTHSAQQGYDAFNPQYKDAANSYADYLKQDPYTDSYSTAALGKATAGTNAAYNAAQSNLYASNAARGLSNDSSGLQGGLASIEAGKAGQVAGAQNNLALQKVADHQRNLGMLADFLHGARNDERGAVQAGNAAQAGIAGEQASIYSGLNNSANEVKASQQKRSDDSNSALFGALGQFTGVLGGGRSAGGGTPPSSNTAPIVSYNYGEGTDPGSEGGGGGWVTPAPANGLSPELNPLAGQNVEYNTSEFQGYDSTPKYDGLPQG